MAVVESTYNWYWLADEFEKRNWNLRLADPSTVSKAGFKYSDDYTDASYLAECVRNGSIRSTAIMPKDDRAVRDLARYRMTLVEDRGRLKTILVNMTANHLSIKLNADKLLKEIDEAVEKAQRERRRGGGRSPVPLLRQPPGSHQDAIPPQAHPLSHERGRSPG